MGLTDTEILDMSGVRIVAGADGRILDLSEHQEPDPITGWDDLPTVGDGGARFRLGDEAEIALAMQEHCLGLHSVYTAGQFWQYQIARRGWYRLTDAQIVTWVGTLSGAPVQNGETKDGEEKTVPLRISAARAKGVAAMIAANITHDETRGSYWAGGKTGQDRGVAQFRDRTVVVTQTGPGKLAVTVEMPHPRHRVRAQRVMPCQWGGLPVAGTFSADCPALYATAFDWWGHHGPGEALDRITAVLEVLGASILGMAPTMSRALMLYGPGGTGKSTLLSLMTQWCKPEAISSVTPQDMGANRFASARLDGAVINMVDDLPADPIQDAGSWKSAITGGRIDVERKGQDGYGIFPECGHIYAGNRLPVAVRANSGFWRRWLVVEYDRVFSSTSDDRDILGPLLGEMGQIMGHAIAAFVATGGKGGRGYTEPACHRAVMGRWEQVSDSVCAFVAECVRPRDPTYHKKDDQKRSEVYDLYKCWAADSGRRPVSKGEFAQRMKDAGWTLHKTVGIWRWACAVTLPND